MARGVDTEEWFDIGHRDDARLVISGLDHLLVEQKLRRGDE